MKIPRITKKFIRTFLERQDEEEFVDAANATA
jgi:hypothetical protein